MVGPVRQFPNLRSQNVWKILIYTVCTIGMINVLLKKFYADTADERSSNFSQAYDL